MSMSSNIRDGMMSIERREHLRTDVQYHVSYDYYSYDGQKIGQGFGITVNVSVGGMMLDTDRPLEASMKMLVEIISPLYMFMATGHVVYTYQLQERQYRVGVHLEEVIQGGWELVTGNLANVEDSQIETSQ
jgi:PilZ domain-containing protein